VDTLPGFDTFFAWKKGFWVVVRIVGILRDCLNHPFTVLGHKLKVRSLLFINFVVELLNDIIRITAQQNTTFLVIDRVEVILNLLAPMQLILCETSILVDTVEAEELEQAMCFIMLD
jgi:hypothetical protein